MNDTPCPVCNFLLEQRRLAFIRREYASLERYENEHEAHKAKCETINGAWYKGLWSNATVTRTLAGSFAETSVSYVRPTGEG